MLGFLFGLLATVKNYVEGILAQFPQSASALASVVATLISYLGFHVSAGQLAAIFVAVATLVSLLIHHSTTAVELRAVKAGKAGK
jgi:hypothetical protein